MIIIPYVPIIIKKGMLVIGKIVQYAGKILIPKCMSGTGTNEYNFEKLPNPPAFKPIKCAKCGRIIHLGEDGYTSQGMSGTENL